MEGVRFKDYIVFYSTFQPFQHFFFGRYEYSYSLNTYYVSIHVIQYGTVSNY